TTAIPADRNPLPFTPHPLTYSFLPAVQRWKLTAGPGPVSAMTATRIPPALGPPPWAAPGGALGDLHAERYPMVGMRATGWSVVTTAWWLVPGRGGGVGVVGVVRRLG